MEVIHAYDIDMYVNLIAVSICVYIHTNIYVIAIRCATAVLEQIYTHNAVFTEEDYFNKTTLLLLKMKNLNGMFIPSSPLKRTLLTFISK